MKHLIVILFADNISVGYNMSNITVEESVGSVELCAVITSGESPRPFNLTVNTIKMTAGYQITINQAITLVAFLLIICMLLLSLSHALSDTELRTFTEALASMHIPCNTYVIVHAKTAINLQNILGINDRFHFSCKRCFEDGHRDRRYIACINITILKIRVR